MLQSFLIFLAPLLQPSNRARWLCLLLLVSMVFGLLFLGSRPGIAVIFPFLPWDKLMHAGAYGCFASLAWVVMGGRSQWGPVCIAVLIGLLDEGMQYYLSFRSADFRDLVADLVGALMAVWTLKVLQTLVARGYAQPSAPPTLP